MRANPITRTVGRLFTVTKRGCKAMGISTAPVQLSGGSSLTCCVDQNSSRDHIHVQKNRKCQVRVVQALPRSASMRRFFFCRDGQQRTRAGCLISGCGERQQQGTFRNCVGNHVTMSLAHADWVATDNHEIHFHELFEELWEQCRAAAAGTAGSPSRPSP